MHPVLNTLGKGLALVGAGTAALLALLGLSAVLWHWRHWRRQPPPEG
jgi:hypothetical protein